jgi:hypothetical protein
MSRDENDGRRRAVGREPVSKLESAHLAEVYVEHEALRFARHVAEEEFFRGAKRFYRDAVSAKHSRKGDADRFIIVDDTDPELMLACGA